MKTLDVIAKVLVVVGGLNWGLVGWLNFDLVAALFGTMSLASRMVYALVGVAAVFQVATLGRMRRRTMVTAGIATLVLAPAHASAQGRTAPDKAGKNIVQVAVEAGGFSTLVAAVKAANLVETLSGTGPFTVFAPSDAAFAKLPAGTVEALLQDKEKLSKVLTLHVLTGKVDAATVIKANGAKPATVNGQPLDITVRGGKVYVNGAQVTTADIQASNGVIHVIDAVLMPKASGAGSR